MHEDVCVQDTNLFDGLSLVVTGDMAKAQAAGTERPHSRKGLALICLDKVHKNCLCLLHLESIGVAEFACVYVP